MVDVKKADRYRVSLRQFSVEANKIANVVRAKIEIDALAKKSVMFWQGYSPTTEVWKVAPTNGTANHAIRPPDDAFGEAAWSSTTIV